MKSISWLIISRVFDLWKVFVSVVYWKTISGDERTPNQKGNLSKRLKTDTKGLWDTRDSQG